MSLLVPFGLKDGSLYEPRQVSNGKSCGCVCPGCQHPLIARQNSQTPHFAHAAGEDCKNGFETAIHLAAKQLIAERMEFSFPAVDLHLPGGYGCKESTQNLYTSSVKQLSEVRVEPWLNGFRPDLVIVDSAGNEVLIEIAVTHFVDNEKLVKIKNRGIHAIEIDISAAREKLDFSLLNKYLFNSPSSGIWLYHPLTEKLKQEYLTKRENEWESRRKAESDKYANYRMLNPREKIKRNIAKAQISNEQLKSLSVFIPGENAFDGGRYTWQSAVLAYISHQVEEYGLEGKSYGASFEPEAVVYWLVQLFDMTPPWKDAEKIAVWKYLKHLETLGIVRQHKNSFFEIIILPKDNHASNT